MKGETKSKFYTIFEISIMLGVSEKSARNKISKLKLLKYKSKDRIALYSEEQIEILRGDRELNDLDYSFLLDERKSAPVVIIYYIYESKMNK